MLFKYCLSSISTALAVAGVLLFFQVPEAQAAQCGPGASPTKAVCSCGDTVMGNYTLPANLSCTGHGLLIGANSITLDGGGYTITGDGGAGDNGVYYNGKSYSTTTNFIVTNFGTGIRLDESDHNALISNTANSNNSAGYKVVDSSSNTLTGNTANSNYIYGFYISASSMEATSNTLTNNTANSNNSYGFFLQAATSNTLTSNTANSNVISGFYFTSASNSNTLTSNTANSNNSTGFNFDGAASTILTSNTANYNHAAGIGLYGSASSVLTSNTMSDNDENLVVFGSTNAQYNISINNTNLVGGKPVYYFYNQHGTAETPLVYDGDSGDIGMFWAISSSYLTVRDATLSANNSVGVYFINTTSSLIHNITANSYATGIKLVSSDDNTLSNNTANLNYSYGIYLSSSDSNALTSNAIAENVNDIFDDGTNTYSNNQFTHNISSQMLAFTEVARTKDLGNSVSFTITATKPDGTTCANCTTINTSPVETSLAYSDNGSGVVTGSFLVTKPGTYSLLVTITDSDGNVAKRNYLFFVNALGSQTTKYYLRGEYATHGQPLGNGNDSRTLLLTAPVSTETWFCSAWIQNSLDDIPDYPLANLSSIDTYSWYKQTKPSDAYIGVERSVTYDEVVDSSGAVPDVLSYTWVNINLTGLNWGTDYARSWYWLTLKLYGTDPYWQTTVAQPSYADFIYSYSPYPAVKSSSNENLLILSATAADTTATSIISIVLENPISSATTTDIVLTSFYRPILNLSTAITSAGAASFTSPSIGTGANTTVSSIATAITPPSGSVVVLAANTSIDLDYQNSALAGMSITGVDRAININNNDSVSLNLAPDSSSVDIGIISWDLTGDRLKKWTETSTGSPTVTHTVGDLASGQSYNVWYDQLTGIHLLTKATADSSGTVTFSYDKGFTNVITFIVEKEVPANTNTGAPLPTASNKPLPIFPLAPGGGVPSSLVSTSTIPAIAALIIGRLYKTISSSSVYVIIPNNYRRHIPNESSFFSYGYTWDQVATVSHAELDRYQVSNLIKLAGDARVYLVSSSARHWIVDEPTFVSLGFSWAAVSAVSQVELDYYRIGDPVRQAGSGQTAAAVVDLLKKGDRGAAVVKLQAKLRTLGLFWYPRNTGFFGTITQQAVKDFQKRYRLLVTGIVDEKTRQKLNGV